MKPKTIGIVGGAGPMAGALLFERIISLSSSLYGCSRDADFPKVVLLSFPFSEMLTPDLDVTQVKGELRGCLEQLRSNGADVLAIACNTLHAFLDEDQSDLIALPDVVEIPEGEIPLVLCTSTSVRFGLHKRFFECEYPDKQTQKSVDWIIDQILSGVDVVQELIQLLAGYEARTVVLGCTELSLFSKFLPSSRILDPLEMVAQAVVQRCFAGRRQLCLQ